MALTFKTLKVVKMNKGKLSFKMELGSPEGGTLTGTTHGSLLYIIWQEEGRYSPCPSITKPMRITAT